MKHMKLALLGGKPAVPEGTIRTRPPIDSSDEEKVLASLRGGNHAYGPNCEAFEDEFAAWNGNRFAITTNSGTAALHLAVATCGCGAGDEVIVPAYSWPSSAACVLYHHAIPVFVDIDYDTMNIDPARIEAAISKRTKAILVVHLHGLPARMDPILEIAVRHGLRVIEDCCQAHGAEYKGTRVGRLADCGAFSFNQSKCLCSGEGGMFVTDNEEIFQRAQQALSFGGVGDLGEDAGQLACALGWMYRNNDLTAALGRAQLAKLDAYLATAALNAKILAENVRDIAGLQPPVAPEGHRTNWDNFVCHVDGTAHGYRGPPERFRNAVMKALQAEGLPVDVWREYILLKMALFQAQRALSQGQPGDSGRSPAYDPAQFPMVQKHSETHMGLTVPLRAPNDELVAQLVGAGIRKVFDGIGALDIDALGAETSV